MICLIRTRKGEVVVFILRQGYVIPLISLNVVIENAVINHLKLNLLCMMFLYHMQVRIRISLLIH